MANILTNLYHDILSDTQTINREMVGAIGAATRDMRLEGAALNQEVRSAEAPVPDVEALTESMEVIAPSGQDFGSKTYKLTEREKIDLIWNGEEQRLLSNGFTMETLLRKQIMQGQRKLVNKMENFLTAKVYKEAYLASVKNGAFLFDPAQNHKDIADIAKIMDDLGTSQMDRSLIIGSAEALRLRTNPNLQFVNRSGSSEMLRQGVIDNILDFDIRQTAARPSHVAGTATGLTLAANYAEGTSSLELAAGDAGTILAGDIVTINNYKYVVQADVVGSAGNSISIEPTGLREAASIGDAVTIDNVNSARCMAFTPDAVHFAARTPLRTNGRDKATSIITVQDAMSGLAFEIAEYPGVLQTVYRISTVYGAGVPNAQNLHILAG